ncbi:MAG: acyl carrier protein [Planctomycetes bacterium]|mgnify:CR=1 FL=1|nr:acyl carrier protein [Planctomycetota bacterium]HNZ66057.1 acyl carrier protein [Planctomycetota bacterium]HPY75387.1 acyl carrier protein [Planctomycetota bacterium]HQB00999.1 acyl carrier protein [Planctomycetota bacterium]HRU51502.1 acyl carrier protein [Planctomycetota bacterium]
MVREEIQSKVIDIVAEVVGISKDNIDVSSTFKDLGADSLAILDIISNCEDAFDMTIADEDAENLKNLQDAVEYIFSKQK